MVNAEASAGVVGAGPDGVVGVGGRLEGAGTGIGELMSTGGAGGGGKMSPVVWP